MSTSRAAVHLELSGQKPEKVKKKGRVRKENGPFGLSGVGCLEGIAENPRQKGGLSGKPPSNFSPLISH